MKTRLIIVLAVIGVLFGIATAYVLGIQKPPQPPAFTPASNPFKHGIYANGIVESVQDSGENINVYPEVSGTVSAIFVADAQRVSVGDRLFQIEDSVQRGIVAQQLAQANLAQAQIKVSQATLKNLREQYDKQAASARLDPRSVSKDTLDNARNSVAIAQANLEAADKQFIAATKAYEAARALLDKYLVHAMSDGTVLAINSAVGSYASPQGLYGTYTEQFGPVLRMGKIQNGLQVRCYLDEILIERLPRTSTMQATMFIHGSTTPIALKYIRLQPNVVPKIQLSNERTERVDLRVLPVIFNFDVPPALAIYAGQLVDVYIEEDRSGAASK